MPRASGYYSMIVLTLLGLIGVVVLINILSG